jgi:hypothetical protein
MKDLISRDYEYLNFLWCNIIILLRRHVSCSQILFHAQLKSILVANYLTAASVVEWLAYWPMIPKIAGSLPAEAVGFFGGKNPQHTFIQKGSKAVCLMSQIFGMLKNPLIYRESRKL